MLEFLPLAIGIGLVVSLIFTEVFGLAAGGMVVPGYIALYLTTPLHVLGTICAALATFAVVHALSNVIIIYGRRRTVMMILVGYLFGAMIRWQAPTLLSTADDAFTVIGYIIPGLIAIWIDRQGIIETLSSLTAASVLVRLAMIVLVGKEMLS